MAEDSMQAAYAELLLSRVLAKSGRSEDAIDAQLRLLEYPVTIIDELSIPLPLYAAERLAQSSQHARPIIQYLDRQESESTLLTGPAIIMLQSLINELRSRPLTDSVSVQFNDLAVELERAMEIQTKLMDLKTVYADGIAPMIRSLSPQRRGASWITFGTEPWLLSVSDTEVPLLVILDAGTIMKKVFIDVGLAERGFSRVRIMSTASDSSRALGSSFPNGHVTLTAATATDTMDPAVTRSIIFLLVTLGAVALAAFGAYMWYKGLQREIQTARMRSSFVSSVSHELKTPLTSIRMFSEILRFKPPEESVRVEYLDTILNESQRLTRLLNNVLNFSKIEEGSLNYQFERVSLNEILSSTMRTMEYPVRSDGFTLQTDIPEEELTVLGDRDALEQVVLNLISNAMKYSIGVKEIAIRLYKNENHACIEVEDHGLGIEPDEIQKIFQSFYRSKDAHRRHIPGTGLGLSIVAHTMEAHDGGVTVNSVPGDGSTFTLYLPIIST
jgi:signal transduction histidine kinase